MYQTKKSIFIQMLNDEIAKDLASENRRTRCNGRIKQTLLNAVVDSLPEIVQYQKTSKGNIKEDYYALNSRYKNVHVFACNPSGVSFYDDAIFRIIIVCKRTHEGVYRIPRRFFIEKRFNLEDIIDMIDHGKAIRYERLADALNF